MSKELVRESMLAFKEKGIGKKNCYPSQGFNWTGLGLIQSLGCKETQTPQGLNSQSHLQEHLGGPPSSNQRETVRTKFSYLEEQNWSQIWKP